MKKIFINKVTYILLFLILILAGILRFTNLAGLPPSLEWDEVATGYDANSILKTGKDQYGNFLPLTFRSLDDYKPPLYTYLTAISIWIWGWNDFAVRFTGAFLGTLAVLTTYGMMYMLFNKKSLAILSAFFLSISPWHILFSRLALETNSTIFFTTAGIWAFIVGLKKGKFLLLSAILFGLNLYLYHNARIFTPLLGLFLLIVYRKELIQQKKYFIFSIIILSIFIIRLIPIMFSIEGQMRYQGTSIFSSAKSIEIAKLENVYKSWITDDNLVNDNISAKLFHSPKILYAKLIFHQYLSHFDPTFWLFTADNPRHHVTEGGLLYYLDLPLMLIGLYFLLKLKNIRLSALIIIWILLVPIPASVTRDAPHSLRTAIFLPTFQILIAFGIIGLIDLLKSRKIVKTIFIIFLICGYGYNFLFFTHQYFVHYAKDTSSEWQYGRQEAALFADSIKQKYDRILVSQKIDQGHMFFLYYLKYDPVKYQKDGGTLSGGWAEEGNKFDKYEFRNFDYEKTKNGKTLFIGSPKEFSPNAQVLRKIKYLNGEDAIWITD